MEGYLVMRQLSLVLIGGDERREQIKSWLRERREIALVAEFKDDNGLRLITHLAPDIVVLDCAAPGINALLVLPWLRAVPGVRHVIALGASDSPAEHRLMLELGAVAYAPPRAPAAFARALATIEKLTTLSGAARATQPALPA
jgi:DNA-binding NarL/FixJ family response regulator